MNDELTELQISSYTDARVAVRDYLREFHVECIVEFRNSVEGIESLALYPKDIAQRNALSGWLGVVTAYYVFPGREITEQDNEAFRACSINLSFDETLLAPAVGVAKDCADRRGGVLKKVLPRT